MSEVLDTVLLLALPASGKSEVRKYLALLSPGQCRDEFHMGPTVQLDDFPYVHFMRCIDEQVTRRGSARIFFQAPDRPFSEPRDWGTLIQLINEDYADLHNHRNAHPKSAAVHLMERIEAAAAKAGIAPRLKALNEDVRRAAADALEAEAAQMVAEKNELCATDLNGKTVVIEFARGGADGSKLPLPAPFGYRYSLGQLSEEILSRSKILYVWTTPEESRRKNHERTDPNDPGSILNHGVPIEVMLKDYGCDDMQWLEDKSAKPGTVTIEKGSSKHQLSVARFDNRVDKTSFVRAERSTWKAEDVKALHEGLKSAFARLAATK